MLRSPEPADAPRLLELASDPEVTRWFSWGPYTSLDEPLAYIEDAARRREAGSQLALLGVPRAAARSGAPARTASPRRCCSTSASPSWGCIASGPTRTPRTHARPVPCSAS